MRLSTSIVCRALLGWATPCITALLAAGSTFASPQESPETLVPPSTRGVRVTSAVDEEKYCDRHPLAAGSNFLRARDAGRGIATQGVMDGSYNMTPSSAPDDLGGGPCQAGDTPLGQAAAAVGALLYDNQLHCSAVLVGENTVVTAAHCVKGFDKARMEFVLGPDSNRPVQRATVYDIGWHDRYEDTHLGINDIGYVYLNQRITDVEHVQLAYEPLGSRNIQLEYVGYGPAGVPAGTRRCVGIPLHDTCDDAFGYESLRMNTCHGDSGGAVFRETGEVGTLLVGVTNWGDPSCVSWGVSADVGFHHDWLIARIHEAPSERPPAPVDDSAPGDIVGEHRRGKLQVAVALAISLKRIRDQDHQLQPLWAPTVFLGFEPLPTSRFAIGLVAGVGFAENTQTGFIGGFGARVDVWDRVGLIAGYGIRLAPDDRVRSSLGVGLTFRLWSLTPRWQ